MALTIQDGYVIFTRGAQSAGYWLHVHNRAAAAAGSIASLYADNDNKNIVAGEYLLALGQAEQAKEIALIQQATGNMSIGAEDIKLFIQNFNEVLVGKEQFKATLTRINAALTNKAQTKDNRAPTIASWFTGALGTALNKNLNAFTNKNFEALSNQDFTAWEMEIDSLIDRSIDEAFKTMLTKLESKSGKEQYGTQESWTEIYEASQQMTGFNQYFQDMVKSKIDFTNLRNIFKSEVVKITNKSHKGFRKFIDSKEGLNLKNEKKSRSIGGSVQEYLETIANSLGQAAQTAASSGGRVFSSEHLKADNVTLFSYSRDIQNPDFAQMMTNQLDEELQLATSLLESTQIMNDYWNNYLSKLDNSFIVYGSTKAYSLAKSFRGFHGGGARALEDAKAVIAQAGMDSSSVDAFVNAAYNTGSGAILAGQKDMITAQLETALASAVANLLFDDWASIGEVSGSTKAIHVLELEGLKVPLSVFLIAAGRAMINAASEAEKIIQVRIKLPSEYPYSDSPIKGLTSKSEVIERWNEVAAEAKKQSSFSITFLKNFKGLISEWISF